MNSNYFIARAICSGPPLAQCHDSSAVNREDYCDFVPFADAAAVDKALATLPPFSVEYESPGTSPFLVHPVHLRF